MLRGRPKTAACIHLSPSYVKPLPVAHSDTTHQQCPLLCNMKLVAEIHNKSTVHSMQLYISSTNCYQCNERQVRLRRLPACHFLFETVHHGARDYVKEVSQIVAFDMEVQ